MLDTLSTLSQTLYNSALAYASCLHRTTNQPWVGESLWLSQVFPMCVHSPIHVPGLLDYKKKYVLAFQSPYGQLIFQFFLLSFSVIYVLLQLLSITLGIYHIKTLAEVFTKLISQYSKATYHFVYIIS